MRSLVFPTLLTLLITSTAWGEDEALPTGAIKKGTLANAQLVADAKLGIVAKVGALGCSKTDRLQPYVAAMPTGPVGQQQWKEIWIVSGCNSKYPVSIDFKEAGTGAADWTIGK